MTGELSRADVKDIRSETVESYKDIKPEKEMSFRELYEFVETEFDKAAKEAETQGEVDDSGEKGLSEKDNLRRTEEPQKEYDKADKENEVRVEVDDLERNNLSDLSDEERLIIKKETNWSDEIIDYIKNMKQYEIYKKADLYEVIIDGKKCLVKNIDMDYVDPKTGLTNRELMERGRAPYDSITGGKKEFSSESACFARGTQIQNAELDYVLDYNEQHPEAPIQPDINYFRCYPVIDEQGEGWYLHFFCRSGEGNDAKLKSMY